MNSHDEPEPLMMPQPPQPERREFVRVAMMLGIGCVGIGAGAYTVAVRLPSSAQAGPLPLLSMDEAAKRKVGAWASVDITLSRRDGYKLITRTQHVFLKRTKDGDTEDCFSALSPICPHAGCGVDLLRTPNEPDRFGCGCHGAKFSAEGAMAGGPAPRDMDPLKLSIGNQEGKRWLMVEWHDYLPGSAERKERG